MPEGDLDAPSTAGSSAGRASYTPLLGAYGALTAALLLFVRRRPTPVHAPGLSDVLLLGLGTFKLSRLLTKEKVTQPLRAPFVADVRPGEGAEVNSRPAGAGVRRAIGELVTCPFCLSVWIATGLTALFALAPRGARLLASGLATVAVSDAGQYLYAGLRRSVR